jgi:hypothetical protein
LARVRRSRIEPSIHPDSLPFSTGANVGGWVRYPQNPAILDNTSFVLLAGTLGRIKKTCEYSIIIPLLPLALIEKYAI